jgi:hypothetical protein
MADKSAVGPSTGIDREHRADARASQLVLALGAYFLGAVYLGGVIATALVYGNPLAVALALVSAGVGYLVQIGQAIFPGHAYALLGMWALSVVAAVGGGLLVIGG